MKKYTFLLVNIILSALYTNAQLKYTISESDPGHYKRTSISLKLLNFESFHGYNLSSGLGFETVIKNKVMPYGCFNYAWADGEAHEENYHDYPEPKGKRQNQILWNAGVVYYFLSKDVDKNVRVILKEERRGNTNITHVTDIPSEVRYMLGVDAGVSQYRKAVEIHSDSNYRYQSMDGTIDLPLNSSFTMGDTAQPAGNPNSSFIMTSSVNFYFGLHFRNVKNTVVLTDKYGERSNLNIFDAYCDLVYAPSTTISNVVDINKVEWKIAHTSSRISHIGYKIGVSRRAGKTRAFSYNLEYGKRPGIYLGSNFGDSGQYISVGCNLNLSF